MSMQILATKLFVPRPPPKVVVRTRLLKRLCEGLAAGRTPSVTLISAPAGFGKTTLASAWVVQCHLPLAWLSLEERDNDPARFLTHLIAALRTLAPAIGEGALRALELPQRAATEAALTALLNDIIGIPNEFVLVLDDYHVIDEQSIDDGMAFLIEHQPPNLHLLIATREDPRLPLARLRAQNQLTELRAADLRFTPSEAAEFLREVMGLTLSADDLNALDDRTEGWIAGLQLAALSMQGRQNIPGFIRAFAGDHRYIMDYLAEEVLQGQPEPVRRFLLQTAILDRLSGPLCDAVSGQEGGAERLEALEQGNFFLVPLDDKRQWYRYHHLFADVLYAHLMAEQPDRVPTLHRLASEWYEHNGLAPDAIRHALAAEDFERAADVIEMAIPAVRRRREDATMLRWLQSLPNQVVQRRPVLCVHYAGALLAGGEYEAVEIWLRDAERWLAQGRAAVDTDGPVVVDEDEFRRLPGSIAMYRAGIALAVGDVDGTVRHAQRVLDLAPDDDLVVRGGAAGLMGLAHWTNGDLEAAHGSYTHGMAMLQRAGHVSDAINGVIILANIRLAQGRLREAMRTYERGLSLATVLAKEQGEPTLAARGMADLLVGMSEVHRERNELDAATQELLRSKDLGEHAGMPQNQYRWRVAMARMHEAQGHFSGALDLLDEAEWLYVRDFSPNVQPIPAMKVRVWIAQGTIGGANRGRALDWARERGLSADDSLSYLREFEHVTLARVLLALYQSNHAGRSAHGSALDAVDLLARLLRAAEEGGRTRSVIEILILQALAHHVQGDVPAALAQARQALALAEPEGYVRLFVDEGAPMAAVLRGVALGAQPVEKPGVAPNYVRQLLNAFGTAEDRTTVQGGLVEPLSERELEVLRLLRMDLSGPEIARQLTVSLSTLRTHTQNIYTKLGVNNRRSAVHRAEDLKLL